MSLAASELSLEFDTPEIETLGVPLVGALAILLIWRYIRAGSRPRTRRAVLAGLAAAAGAAGLYVARDLEPAARRGLLLALIAAGTLVLTPLTYSKTAVAIPRSVTWGLLALRLAVVIAVLMVLARPVVRRTALRIQRPTLAVLLDDSRSMRIRDMPGDGNGVPSSRADAVKHALASNWRRIERLDGAFDVVGYRFGEVATRAGAAGDDPWPLETKGQVTDVAAALSLVAERAGTDQSPLGAVLIVSDGSNNAGADSEVAAAARSLADLDVPIFAVGVGSAEPRGDSRSLFGRDLRGPGRVAVRAIVPIEADFEAIGFADTPIDVECLWDGEVIATRRLVPSSAREVLHARFERVAGAAGFHAVEVRARPTDLRWKDAPATLSQFVRVIDDQIHILYVEAHPRSEGAFITRALAGEPRFQLTKALLGRPVQGMWSDPLPRERARWQRYHAIILGDLTRRDLKKTQMAAIRDVVLDFGTGLAVIGGFENTGRRSFAETALADVIPVKLGAGSSVEGAVRLRVTIAGRDHPICRIGEDGDVERAWSGLPSLAGLTMLGTAKPTAETLVTDETGRPAIVTGTVGKGRVLAMAVDSTWRWRMQIEGGAAVHQRFWRQMIYWIANRRPDVHITVSQPRYDVLRVRPGTRGIEIEAFVVNGLSGLTLEAARLDVTLTTPDGQTSKLDMQTREDRWVQRLFPKRTGTYELLLVASHEGQEVGRSQTRFVVESVDLERRQPLANLALMQGLADATSEAGGRFALLADLRRMLQELGDGDFRRQVIETTRQDLGDTLRWPILAVVCGLLALEWVIRKRFGLV